MAILRISLDSCTTERVEDVTGSGLDLAFSLFDEFRDSDPVIFTSPHVTHHGIDRDGVIADGRRVFHAAAGI